MTYTTLGRDGGTTPQLPPFHSPPLLESGTHLNLEIWIKCSLSPTQPTTAMRPSLLFPGCLCRSATSTCLSASPNPPQRTSRLEFIQAANSPGHCLLIISQGAAGRGPARANWVTASLLPDPLSVKGAIIHQATQARTQGSS